MPGGRFQGSVPTGEREDIRPEQTDREREAHPAGHGEGREGQKAETDKRRKKTAKNDAIR